MMLPFNARSADSNPGRELRPHRHLCWKNGTWNKQYCNKCIEDFSNGPHQSYFLKGIK